MKKVLFIIFLSACSLLFICLGYNQTNNQQVRTYYNVYFKGETIGIVDSETELLTYIEKKQDELKHDYSTENVYVPNEIDIEKIISYKKDVDLVEDVYKTIENLASFTIDGYQITITNEENKAIIYVTKRELFDQAVENVIKLFVGEDKYNQYKNGTQQKIDDTGVYINSIYLDNNISIKETKVSTKEKIYSTADEIAQYLMYGNNNRHKKYVTSIGDTIESISFKNEISTEEFIMANSQFSSINSLIYPGQEVTISVLDPQIRVTVEQKVVENNTLQYNTVETIDEEKVIGYTSVVQNGENGIIKVAQDEKIVNGTSVYVKPISKEVIKPAVDKIVIKGGKKVSGVGSLTDWAWPTDSGWSITSKFGYRINPFTHKRELHGAIDIAGTGYGSPVYAANNGIIMTKTHNGTAGNYIVINHNNGYYTQYNHMSKFANVTVGQAVEKGQIIGYVGMTGQATGPHLHFAVWVGRPWVGGYQINPFNLY